MRTAILISLVIVGSLFGQLHYDIFGTNAYIKNIAQIDSAVIENLNVTGTVSITGTINCDTLDADMHINNDGTLQVDGRADFDGTVEFGNSAANDTVLLVSRIGSNLDPITNGGFSLGVSARRWDLFADDVNIADSFTVTGTADFGGNVSFGGTIATAADVIPDSSVNYGADLLTAVNGWWGDTSSNYATAADVGAKADTTVTNAILDSLGTISPELDLYLEYSAAPDTLTASTIASGNAGSVVFLPRNTVASTAHYNVVGGTDNSSTMPWTTIGGGTGHTATAWYATIGGGNKNTASDSGATVSGGQSNTASGDASTVAGGVINTASGTYSGVGGGRGNTASGDGSTVAGGYTNTASGDGSTVAGGQSNTASGKDATVAGGYINTASGYASFAFGQYVTAADSFSAHFFAADDSFDTAYEGELVVGGAIRVEHDTLSIAVLVDSSGLTADVDTSFKQGFDWFKDNPEYYVQGVPSGSDTIRPSAYSIGDYIFIYVQTGPPMTVKESLVVFVDLDGSDSIFSVAYDTITTLTDTIFTAYDGVSVFRTIYTSYLTADSITAANWIAAVRVDADSMAADYFIGGISEMDTVVADKIVTDTLVMGSDELTDLGMVLEFFDSTGTYTALSAWLAGDYLGLTDASADVDTTGTDIAAALGDRQPLCTALTQLCAGIDSVTFTADSLMLVWKYGKPDTTADWR